VTVYTVNSTADAVDAQPGNGTCATASGACTLRAAVQEADKHQGQTSEIDLPAGTYTLSIRGQDAGTPAPAKGDLDLTANISVVGAGASTTTVTTTAGSGSNGFNDRLFDLPYQGGGVAWTISLSGLTIDNGAAGSQAGGAIDVEQSTDTSGSFTLANSVVQNSRSSNCGGGLTLDNGLSPSGHDFVFTNVTITGNVAGGGGGGICQYDGGLQMSGSTISNNTVQNGYGGGGIESAASQVTISDSTITGNHATVSGADGGGLQLSDSVDVSGNPVFDTLTNDEISNNAADYEGGGIYADGTTKLNVVSSALDGNSVASDTGSAIFNAGTLTLTNSSVFRNSVPQAVYSTGASAKLTYDSLALNTGGGLGTASTAPAVKLDSTLLAQNPSGNCSGKKPSSLGHNLDDGSTCGLAGTGDQTGVNAKLAAAQPVGSPPTIALGAGSPAIDAGAAGTCPAADERGQARPVDGNGDGTAACDTGAFEFVPPPSSIALTRTSVPQGGSTTVKGTGFQPSEAVTLELDGTTVLAHATAAADGTFSKSVKVPLSTATGSHTVDASGSLGSSGSAPVTVTAGYAALVLAGTPVAYYRLDDTGTTMADSSGNHEDAAYSTAGNVTHGVKGALASDPDKAVSSTGGTNPVGSLASASFLPSGNSARTIEAWYRSTDTTRQAVVGYGAAARSRAFGMAVAPNQVVIDVYLGEIFFSTGTKNLDDGKWHYLVVTYDGTKGAAYADGKPLSQQSSSATLPLDTASPSTLFVGGWLDSVKNAKLDGSVDEVAIYPTALSKSTVAAHFNASH